MTCPNVAKTQYFRKKINYTNALVHKVSKTSLSFAKEAIFCHYFFTFALTQGQKQPTKKSPVRDPPKDDKMVPVI